MLPELHTPQIAAEAHARGLCAIRVDRAQGTKSFKSIDTKALSMTTDAVVLHPHLSKVARRVRDLY